MKTPKRGGRTGEVRVSGVWVLAGVVLLGFGAGAGYFFYKNPRVRAEAARELAEAPTTPEGKLAMYFEWHRISILDHVRTARLSKQQPWIVTHTERATADRERTAPEDVWGIETEPLTPEAVQLEGLAIVVRVPAPRLLATTVLIGDKARAVPSYAPSTPVPDPAEKLEELLHWFLRDMEQALAKDIPEARIRVQVSPE